MCCLYAEDARFSVHLEMHGRQARSGGPGLQALAEILRSKRVTSAMTRSAIVDLLRAMLQGSSGGGRGASLAPPPMRPGAAALTEALFRTVSDAGVVPALMVAYSEADAVEGLDVDKYHFDKFTMRNNVDVVLRELWKDEQCLKDLMRMATPGGPECGPLLPASASTSRQSTNLRVSS